MTCPTTACFNGLPLGDKNITVGGKIRYFGDGWQISKWIGGRRYWRIPVMDGEFLCEETFGLSKGSPAATSSSGFGTGRHARGRRVGGRRHRQCPDVILPFPGGIARSGRRSVANTKSFAPAQTRLLHPPCEALLRPRYPDARCAYEIVIDGLTLEAVERATAAGLHAADAHARSLVPSPRATTAESSASFRSGCTRPGTLRPVTLMRITRTCQSVSITSWPLPAQLFFDKTIYCATVLLTNWLPQITYQFGRLARKPFDSRECLS